MPLQLGDPIWIESLMSEAEYQEWRKMYPKMAKMSRLTQMFDCEFKWRWRMGEYLTKVEIDVINKRMDILKKMAENGNTDK